MEEFDKRMDKEFEKRLEGLRLSQQPPAMIQHDLSPVSIVNAKESCSTIEPSGGDFGSIGQCVSSFSLINVMVYKVLYANVAIHVPTSEVTIVVEALHTFIV